MLTRSKKRLDYKKLGETGERTEKQLKGEEEADRDNIGEVSKNTENTLSIEESTIADDLSDFIDENKVEDMLYSSEIDNKISKLEELRTGYRRKHKELKILSGI